MAEAAQVPAAEHYRPSADATKQCSTCRAYAAGVCTMFPGNPPVSPSYVCDGWEAPEPAHPPAKVGADHHNAVLDAARARVDELEPKLVAVLEPLLRRAGEDAARNFSRFATDHLTAAGPLTGVQAASTMICVRPRAPEAAAIADPDGAPPDDLHCTLAFLGEIEGELGPIRDALAPVAAAHGPLVGVVGGYGQFQPPGCGILLPDVPGLVELRVAVTEALTQAGIEYGRDHGFEAHVTVTGDPSHWAGNVPGTYAADDPLGAGEPATGGGSSRRRMSDLRTEPFAGEPRSGEGGRSDDLRPPDRLDAPAGDSAGVDASASHLRERALPQRGAHEAGDELGARSDSQPAAGDVFRSWHPVRFARQPGMGRLPGLRERSDAAVQGAEEGGAYPASACGLPLHFDSLLLVRGDVEQHDLPLVGPRPLTADGSPGPPDWTPPAADELVDADALVALFRGKTDPIRLALIQEVLGAAFGTPGVTEAEAIAYYHSPSAHELNDALRSGKPLTVEQQSIVNALDAAMTPSEKNMVLWRSVSNAQAEEPQFSTPGYLATSETMEAARGTADPAVSARRVVIGETIGKESSAYAPGTDIVYRAARGVSVPALESDQVYLVRFSTADEAGEIGHYAYAGKNLDDVINATEAYAHLEGGTDSGYLYIGRTTDAEWDYTAEEEASGIELNGVLGTEDAPLDTKINLATGDVEDFAGAGPDSPVVMEIKVPAGTPMLEIPGDNPEWLLPRGITLEVGPSGSGNTVHATATSKGTLSPSHAGVAQGAGLSFDVSNPLIDGLIAKTGQHITSIVDTTRANVMRVVGSSYDAGLSIPDTAKAIRAVMTDAAPKRAIMIARTEMTSAVNGASLAAANLIGETTGASMTKTWLTAPGAQYPRHEDYEDLDGQTVALEATFTVGEDELQYPGDPDGSPEEVINCRCEAPWNQVSARPLAAARRTYEGQLVRLTTAGGRELSVTPNHPVLTRNGWVAAGILEEGDEVVCRSRLHLASGCPDVDDVPAQAEERFASLQLAAARRERVRGRAVNLHGEIPVGEVEVVWADDPLPLEDESAFGEKLRELALALAHREVGFDGNTAAGFWVEEPDPVRGGDTAARDTRAPQDVLDGSALDLEASGEGQFALAGAVRGDDLSGDGRVGVLERLALRGRERSTDASGAEVLPDGHRSEAALVRDLLVAHAALVELDPVIDLARFDYAGHVYSFSTATGAYISSGILSANCAMTYSDGTEVDADS